MRAKLKAENECGTLATENSRHQSKGSTKRSRIEAERVESDSVLGVRAHAKSKSVLAPHFGILSSGVDLSVGSTWKIRNNLRTTKVQLGADSTFGADSAEGKFCSFPKKIKKPQ